MKWVRRIAAVTLPIVLVGWSGPGGVVEAAAPAPAEPNGPSDRVDPGRLVGVVTDTTGAPLEASLISATGPTGVSVVLCDAQGRFEFRGLDPGTYLVRAHVAGFSQTERSVVHIRPGLATVQAVTLHRAAEASAAPSFLAAGVGGGTLGLAWQPEGEAGSGADADSPRGTALEPTSLESDDVPPHDDSEKAWRIRRARRSVLKDSDFAFAPGADGYDGVDPKGGFTPLVIAADHRAAAAYDASGAFPVSGQLHLLTRARIDSSTDLWSTDILPGQVAHVSLGGADDESRWMMRGAMRTGDAGAWVVAGRYLADPSAEHALEVGLSYSRQNLQPAASNTLTPSAAVLEEASQPSVVREVGSLSVDGQWNASSLLSVDYGANVARYGYLPEDGLMSPNAILTVAPLDGTRVRVAVAQYMLAPGAEEFLPPAEGVWLPPERTFAVLSPTDPLSVERSRHVELALERDLGESMTVGVRSFYQDVDDQMVALFGVRPQATAAPSDHYYLTSANGVTSQGWGVMFSHAVSERVRGAVDYTLTSAEWAPWSADGLSPHTVGVFRTGTERFHDVTTSVETEIPETATEVFVLYRINTAFSVRDASTDTLTSGLDGRFALRVKQTLPFSPFDGSDWEVLVDVRSLFREQAPGASVYDELLVTNPPKQVVGGLIVHF